MGIIGLDSLLAQLKRDGQDDLEMGKLIVATLVNIFSNAPAESNDNSMAFCEIFLKVYIYFFIHLTNLCRTRIM